MAEHKNFDFDLSERTAVDQFLRANDLMSSTKETVEDQLIYLRSVKCSSDTKAILNIRAVRHDFSQRLRFEQMNFVAYDNIKLFEIRFRKFVYRLPC